MPPSLMTWQVRPKYLSNRVHNAHFPGDCIIGASPSHVIYHCTQSPISCLCSGMYNFSMFRVKQMKKSNKEKKKRGKRISFNLTSSFWGFIPTLD